MNTKQNRNRQRIAEEAAKWMIESGSLDHRMAKLKAAQRLRTKPSGLPRNREIEDARIERRRIFDDEGQGRLEGLRRCALETMQLLEPFGPRLVGQVLEGDVDHHSEICLHLFCDPPEEVALFLIERRIRYRESEARLRFDAGGDVVSLPAFLFSSKDMPITLIVFSGRLHRRVPLGSVDNRPVRRAKISAVAALLAEFPSPGEGSQSYEGAP
ncbi:hypothetical protein [Thioalkalivibrio sp. HK1]|uniref:hypothetical protein n=1 Tax=Thioalkalivibrio sp. HK1 TaxID=1469245 RepID=UPI000472B822|nr:hypothetical protein [Thioalkalivibrio sp. HK1]